MNFLIILIAQYLFIFSPIIAGIYFLKQTKSTQKEILIFGLISLPLIYIASIISAHLYYDPRPFVVGHFTPLIPHAPDNGFPSDHVLLLSAIASIISFYGRKIAIILWIITILVAIARVFSGIHHPIDVLGSIMISFLTSYAVYIFLKHAKLRKSI
jgi:undecaprenyl-diphosphatase